MKVGDTAEDFTLQNTNGNEVTLYDELQNNNVLLLFFPLAFSSVCTDEMCHFRDNKKLYNALNANILGVSVDSFFTLREFKRSNNLPFPLLSDFNKTVSKKYGVLYENYFGMKGVSKRASFIINQDHTVEYAEVLEDSGDLPDFKAIERVLGE